MTPFEYGGFYDVPLWIRIGYEGRYFVLERYFDEELDEYPNFYEVYLLPESAASVAKAEWNSSHAKEMVSIGRVEVSRIVFDERKREAMNASFLDGLIGAAGI